MLNIKSLLNPLPSPSNLPSYSSPSPTPIPFTPKSVSTMPTPQIRTPKDEPVWKKAPTKGEVNYAPYESTERHAVLNKVESDRLREQHRRFCIQPSGGSDGLIVEYAQTFPYKSDKRTFFTRSGRDVLETFKYTFTMPDGMLNPGKKWTVMWDYNIGLVRITPFFKSFGLPKTQPNKVLELNDGLRELSHSITGGAIIAQGYWMPYQCARDICATFCWDIRWALTPIFGPSFLHDCKPPGSTGFQTYKTHREVIRQCTLEAEGWSHNTSSRVGTPMSGGGEEQYTSAPRSAPQLEQKVLRSRASRPNLRVDSPFDSSSSASSYEEGDSSVDSPCISPKTTPLSWTSINHNHSQPYPHSVTGTPTPTPTPVTKHLAAPQDSLFASTSTPIKSKSKAKGKNKAKLYTTDEKIPKITVKRPSPSVAAENDSDNDTASVISITSSTSTSSNSSDSSSKHKTKRARVGISPGAGKFKAREYNAAIALLQMAQEDVEMGGQVALL